MILVYSTGSFLKFINKITKNMARVTVEDCVLVVPNRFDLCLVASNRAKSILSGAATAFDRKEKPAVIALREVADNAVDVENVRKNISRNIRHSTAADYNELVENSAIEEVVMEEVESQGLTLKDNTFVDDNIEVDD